MPDQPQERPKIQIDSDWKQEAQREKERLAREAQEDAQGPLPAASFAELLNMLLMQTLVALGAIQTPDGQRMAPDLEVAKHYVDMLMLLGEKTKGNLTDDEDKLLKAAIYELQMRFVQISNAMASAPPPPPGPQPK